MTRAFAAWSLIVVLAGCEGKDVLLYGSDDAARAGMGAAPGAGGNSGGLGGTGGSLDAAGSSATGGNANTGGTTSTGGALNGGGMGNASGSGTGGDMSTGTPCNTNADCPPSWFCSKKACDDLEGTCFNSPIFCPPDAMPVCGCDHVSYWNTCVRESYGISADLTSTSECGPNGGDAALPCFNDKDCMVQGLTCAHLLGPIGSCSDAGPGACWGTPLDCSDSMENRRWIACPPPPPGANATCVSTCDAIQSGQNYVQARRDMPCN